MNDTFNVFDQYDIEHKNKLPFKKRWIVIGAFILFLIATLIYVYSIYPKKDRISIDNLPVSYIIENQDNYWDSQSGRDCTGYAAAYVLRHFGIKAYGPKIYSQMPTSFSGGVGMHNIVGLLKQYGLNARLCYGSIETLKAEINKGVPVIADIKIILGANEEKHVVAIVGYDEEYIYMADSTGYKTNIEGVKMYNRKVKCSDFEYLWDVSMYPGLKNVYIVVDSI